MSPVAARWVANYKGPAGVLELLGKLQERSEGSLAVDVVEVFGSPERAVVIQEETAHFDEIWSS
jgi:hypothetical protein